MASLSHQISKHFKGETQPECRYLIVRSANPNVFNLGGDLGYFQSLIHAGDREKLAEYATAAVDMAYRNYLGHDIPGLTTVALLEGDALGGGFESALSCDVVVVEKHVKAGFPEVLFNMFPGMGGISFLSRRVGRTTVNELTSSGRLYSAQELLDLGVVDHVVDTGSGVDAVRQLMRRRERREEAHSSMNVVDKLLRPVTRQELHDVVGMWVDRALRLSPRGLEWMKRIHQQQVATFPTSIRRVAMAA